MLRPLRLLLVALPLLGTACSGSLTHEDTIMPNDSQVARDHRDISHAVTRFFAAVDDRDWNTVAASMTDSVLLDYESFGGGPPKDLAPAAIVDAWRGILPGFDHTHHQLGNLDIEVDGDAATVRVYGTATHSIDDAVWTVIGRYDMGLVREDARWKLARHRFGFRMQTGDTSLPQRAMARVSGETRATADASATAARNKATVRRSLALLEAENIPAFVDLFADDGRQINPYASGLFPEGAEGHDALLAYWTPVPGNFAGMRFPIDELLATEDPNVVFVRFRGEITLREDKGVYANDYFALYRFDEAGKITEYVEVFNPVVAARAFGIALASG